MFDFTGPCLTSKSFILVHHHKLWMSIRDENQKSRKDHEFNEDKLKEEKVLHFLLPSPIQLLHQTKVNLNYEKVISIWFTFFHWVSTLISNRMLLNPDEF